jgi:tRNA (guanine-N7-)-methyltransferase
MAKNKLGRYAEVEQLPNVTEVSELGMWKSLEKAFWLETFGVDALDLTLELACGKGEYALALAQRYPDRQFIGIDIKGERLWRGAKEALELGLSNLYFLRVYIDHLELYIPEASVDEIWIPFSDPYVKQGKETKRLTSPRFLAEYYRILRPHGMVHVKTDSPELAEYTREQISEGLAECAWDVTDIYEGQGQSGEQDQMRLHGQSGEQAGQRAVDYSAVDHATTHQEFYPIPAELWSVQTYYEKKHIASGRTISYIGLRPTPKALAFQAPQQSNAK